MIHAIMGLGRMLGMAVCAEGVETAEQSDWLREQRLRRAPGLPLQPPARGAPRSTR